MPRWEILSLDRYVAVTVIEDATTPQEAEEIFHRLLPPPGWQVKKREVLSVRRKVEEP